MENFKILTAIWKNKRTYELIEEELLMENTFIQQTSKNENLWKAQIGTTRNYVIFLRCAMDYSLDQIMNTNSCPPCSYVLINMIPMSHLKVSKHSRRKLEILFPSGCLSYFKLLMCPGCGKAWKCWKKLEELCDNDILPLVPLSRVIYFSDIDEEIQRNLIYQKFTFSLTILRKYAAQSTGSEKSEYSSRSLMYQSTSSKQSTDSGVSSFGYGSDIQKEGEKSEEKEIVHKKESKIMTHKAKTDKNVRKTRAICRFGEGIPEGCVFGLSFSYSDRLDADKEPCNKILKRKSSKDEPDIGFYDYFSSEKLALKVLQDSSTDYESSEQEKKSNKIKKFYKDGKRKEYMNLEKILNATQFFTNVSLLVVPDGLRRSKSVDSISKISPKRYDKVYLNYNISVPNINELTLYRRYNRLSYSMDYFDDSRSICPSTNEHSVHSISFWLPDELKYDGRIYCTKPICRKISSHKAKNFLIKQNCIHSRNINDTLRGHSPFLHHHGAQRIRKTTTHHRNGNLSSLFNKRTEMATKVLHEMEKEYPERQRLCKTQYNGRSALLTVNQNQTDESRSTKNNRKSLEGRKMTNVSLLSSKSFKKPMTLKSPVVAYELQRIQQRLFCEIEASEIARYILKPETVTEVNCPYLYGFLSYFERLKNLVTTEILSQKNAEEAAQVHRIFVKMSITTF